MSEDLRLPESLREAALAYHRLPRPGKISVVPTKAMLTQRDLSLAYSPGVAEACVAIAQDPQAASELTSRANLVAVITNGTAVLGLGNIGALAGKPVMEGKGCLFKKFAGIDVFDIELDESDPDAIVDTIARMEPTFGGINLEDIKAPECFYIEKKLRERMKIPVFHDDQHGTAIVAAAAALNGLEHVGKKIGEIKLVCSGAGAAAIACLDLLVSLGVDRSRIFVCDSKGVVHSGRENLDESKARYAQSTEARTLAEVCHGADLFLGLSSAGVLKPEMVASMARSPIVLAMANPDPEISPDVARQARPDVIIGTGRSDYPNQVNNVLCFPFIFRGALDCGATTINEEMKVATVRALAALAHAEIPDTVAQAYGASGLRFGPEYLIPKPFDPRLIQMIAPAVAQAAAESGVAQRPIEDLDAYRQQLGTFVYQTVSAMQPVFSAAKAASAERRSRVLYAEGEDERVLRAAQIVVDEKLAWPVLVGRPDTIVDSISAYGLRLRPGTDCEVLDPLDERVSGPLAREYHQRMRRHGMTADQARTDIRARPTLLGGMLLAAGGVDAMLCGVVGRPNQHLRYLIDTVGLRKDSQVLATIQMLMLPNRQMFICDTHVNEDPTAEELVEIAMLAAAAVRRFGIEPRVALLSHSNFGSSERASARKMQRAAELLRARQPDFEFEGEMQGDSALSQSIREHDFGESDLAGDANVLIMPNIDAANISYNLLRVASGGGITVGGILLGAAAPVHVLTQSSTVRRVVNMTAVAVADAAIPSAVITPSPAGR